MVEMIFISVFSFLYDVLGSVSVLVCVGVCVLSNLHFIKYLYLIQCYGFCLWCIETYINRL